MRIICTLVLLFTVGCSSLYAQSNSIYVKLTGPNGVILGESMSEEYKEHVEAESFAQATTGNCSNASSGDVTCQSNTGNFFLETSLSRAINPLRSFLYRGQPITRIDVFFVRNSGSMEKPQLFYSIRLEDVFVASINDAFSVDSDRNNLQVELKASRVGWTYYRQNVSGPAAEPVKFGWDINKRMEWKF